MHHRSAYICVWCRQKLTLTHVLTLSGPNASEQENPVGHVLAMLGFANVINLTHVHDTDHKLCWLQLKLPMSDGCCWLCRAAAGVTSPGSGLKAISAATVGTALPSPSRLLMSSHRKTPLHATRAPASLLYRQEAHGGSTHSGKLPHSPQTPTAAAATSAGHHALSNPASKSPVTHASLLQTAAVQSVTAAANQSLDRLSSCHASSEGKNASWPPDASSLPQPAQPECKVEPPQQRMVHASPILHPRSKHSELRGTWSAAPKHLTQKRIMAQDYLPAPATVPRHRAPALHPADIPPDSASLLASAGCTDSLALLNRLVDRAARHSSPAPGSGPMVSTWTCAVAAAGHADKHDLPQGLQHNTAVSPASAANTASTVGQQDPSRPASITPAGTPPQLHTEAESGHATHTAATCAEKQQAQLRVEVAPLAADSQADSSTQRVPTGGAVSGELLNGSMQTSSAEDAVAEPASSRHVGPAHLPGNAAGRTAAMSTPETQVSPVVKAKVGCYTATQLQIIN